MNAPFAPLQAATNRTVLATLANAVAVVNGSDVPVLFDQVYEPAYDTQVDAAITDCVGDSTLLAGVERGDTLFVAGKLFRVERAEPDGTGLTRLLLGPTT